MIQITLTRCVCVLSFCSYEAGSEGVVCLPVTDVSCHKGNQLIAYGAHAIH